MGERRYIYVTKADERRWCVDCRRSTDSRKECSSREQAVASAIECARRFDCARVVERLWSPEYGCWRLNPLWPRPDTLRVPSRRPLGSRRQLAAELRRRLGEAIDLAWLEDIEDAEDREFLVRLALQRLVTLWDSKGLCCLDPLEEEQFIEQVVHQIVG